MDIVKTFNLLTDENKRKAIIYLETLEASQAAPVPPATLASPPCTAPTSGGSQVSGG